MSRVCLGLARTELKLSTCEQHAPDTLYASDPDRCRRAGKSTQERLGERLSAIEREITAVNAALEGFDQEAEADESEDGHEEVAEEQRELPADVRLQRAGLEQRLADLQAKQRQLEDALARELDGSTLPAKGPAAKQPLQLQEDDRFLDEELDNAHNSAMVETERDRLIRLVRACPGNPLTSAMCAVEVEALVT